MRDYTVIDLEMTGLDPKRDVILEIGAVRVRNGQCVEQFNVLVNPHRRIPDKVTEITGITEKEAADGLEVREALARTEDFLGEDPLVGHNIIYDYSFLKQAAVNEKREFEKQAADTLKIARKFLPKDQKKTLEALCAFYGIERKHGHRACHDAKMTFELYERLYLEFAETEPEAFEPKTLCYRTKRQTPASERQKKRLSELLDYHGLSMEIPWESLTRNEASRMTDQIISKHGRLPESRL